VDGIPFPGMMRVMDFLSHGLLCFLAELIILLTVDLMNEVYPDSLKDSLYPVIEQRQCMQTYFADKCHLQKDCHKLRADGLAVIFGNTTKLHFDTLNDHRVGYSLTSCGSILIDTTEQQWKDETQELLAHHGFNPNCFLIMLIPYTRSRIGVKIDQLIYGCNTNSNA
jgi:hypothetical protein